MTSQTGGGSAAGAASGVLAGTYPAPTFANGSSYLPAITTAEVKLSALVNITPINTYVDGPTLTPAAGVYLLLAHALLYCGTGNPAVVGAKLWDGTIDLDSGNLRSLGGLEGCVPLLAVVTTTGTTTYKISVITTSVTGTPQLLAATDTNAAGNNATRILAIRLA